MKVILYVTVAAIALFGVFIVWGLVRLRKGNAQASRLIKGIRTGDLNHLVSEGKQQLAKIYGITIDFTEPEAAAKSLDGLFRDKIKLKSAFQKPGFYWYFVLPVGALIGEFIRINAKGVWKDSPEGPLMKISLKDGDATCYPFDKVLKQVTQGEKGDIYAFLVSSMQLSKVSDSAV
jgi:hypothetical protein